MYKVEIDLTARTCEPVSEQNVSLATTTRRACHRKQSKTVQPAEEDIRARSSTNFEVYGRCMRLTRQTPTLSLPKTGRSAFDLQPLCPEQLGQDSRNAAQCRWLAENHIRTR